MNRNASATCVARSRLSTPRSRSSFCAAHVHSAYRTILDHLLTEVLRLAHLSVTQARRACVPVGRDAANYITPALLRLDRPLLSVYSALLPEQKKNDLGPARL